MKFKQLEDEIGLNVLILELWEGQGELQQQWSKEDPKTTLLETTDIHAIWNYFMDNIPSGMKILNDDISVNPIFNNGLKGLALSAVLTSKYD